MTVRGSGKMPIMDSAMDRTLRVDGLVNARDLGGLPRRAGSRTPYAVFYRSESVDRITPAGWEQVHAAGIRTVVDLRQPVERECDTTARPEWLTTVHVDHDGLDEHPEFWADYWETGLVGTALYYLPHLAALPERSGRALTAIVSAPPGGVLFHCMGGRDRTGLLSLLLLAAVDTEPEAVLEDYLETTRNADPLAASFERTDPEAELEALCQTHGTTTGGAFRDVLDRLDLDAVLDASGLSAADRSALATWRGAL